MDDCVFCKIVEGKIQSEFVYQDDQVVAFRDINPKAAVHILIIPRKHLVSLDEATDDDKELFGQLLLVAKQVAVNSGIDKTGYRLSLNNGSDAGQEVGHLHFHLLGGQKLGSI